MKVPIIGLQRQRRSARWLAVVLACALSTACQHNKHSAPYEPPDPIEIHVQSENFLDADVYIVAGGVAQRLGTVIGNNKANFRFRWNNGLASGVVMEAVTIGGQGTGRSINLSVNPGQVIDFRIASVLRQTYATVHDP